LHPNKPSTSRSSKVYFLWLRKMSLLDLATSIQGKISIDQDS